MFMTYSRECSLNVVSCVTGFTVCVISFFLFFFFFFFFQDICRWELFYGLLYLSLHFF